MGALQPLRAAPTLPPAAAPLHRAAGKKTKEQADAEAIEMAGLEKITTQLNAGEGPGGGGG